uniref:Histone-binding protein RBBP4-like N-terminal domain-containing protein n=1 Tax=Guillardia theta TaxID=55529 RepID=A0A7S4L2N7_GUITH|mmetsp:Transcript_35693/g.111673  ORF Transcript_35693/g.111673 Transcript_35693/m.111673 type:complete len:423 (+) Transcript_35693:47-1315(+)
MGSKDNDQNDESKDTVQSNNYQQWKKHTPLLYDTLINHHLTHPSSCIRWGHRLGEEQNHIIQRVYYCERGAAPNTIISANVKIAKPRTTDPMKMDKFEETLSSPSVTVLTRIPTPNGTEVNKIYTCEQNLNILFTKSDLNELHVWDLSSPESFIPVATLTGHSEGSCDSNFALDSSVIEPRVLSGDRDGIILMWSLDNNPKSTPGRDANGMIPPLSKFEGHQATVEDVCFNPSSSSEFCSVGDDQKLLFWDARASNSKISEALQRECVDLHCVDWNPSDLNLLVVGTASGATFVVDRRKIGGGEGIEPLHKLHQHQEPVFRVGWRPDSTVHYASGGDDCFVCIWDISQLGAQSESMGEAQESKEVIFKHCGHRGSVQDLHWNPVIPWTLASVSEDAAWVILSEPFPPLSSSTPVCRSSSRSS